MFNLLSFFMLLLVLLLSTGCSGPVTHTTSWQDESIDLVWPEAPDVPRIRYLRDLSGPGGFLEKRQSTSLFRWMFGEQEFELPLLSPFAVAVSNSGTVWIADNGARSLHRLDVGLGKSEVFREIAGILLGAPSGVAVDDVRKRVFLSDSRQSRVFVLNSKGEYIDSWGPKGGFKRPAGLALDAAGRLLVADAVSGVVYVFSSDGNVVTEIRSKLNQNGFFSRPLNVAVGPKGEVLILDALSFRVEVQDAHGNLLSTLGSLGDAAGFLARPKGLAVDSRGHVFISDSAFDNIQVFDLAGNLLMFFGEAGSGAGQFNLPAGLYVDSSDRLFVADSYNHRIQVFQLLENAPLDVN